jgi:hypothetical protein
VRLEGLIQLKNAVISSGMKPMTFCLQYNVEEMIKYTVALRTVDMQ